MQYYTSIVHRHLKSAPDLYRVRMSDVADALNFSETTLARRLTEEGASYSAMIDAEKKRRLIAAIEEDPRSTAWQLAEVCGLSCGQSLTRAVNRWFGLTLTDYKKLLESV